MDVIAWKIQVQGINVNIVILGSSFQIRVGFWLWSTACVDTEGFRALRSEQSSFLLKHAKHTNL